MFAYILTSYTREALSHFMSICPSVTLADVFLFAFHKETAEPNLIKLKKNKTLADISGVTQVQFYLDCFTDSKWRIQHVSQTHVFVRFSQKLGGLNLMKLCTKLADTPIYYIGPLLFRIFHLFKKAAVSLTSLPKSI